MTYRGIIRQGVVVFTHGEQLADGLEVEVTPLPAQVTSTPDEQLPGFGFWSDRTDLPEDSAEAARVLRRLAEERGG